MNKRIYDLCMITGIVCCTTSAWLLAGGAVALGVAGGLVMAATVVSALLSIQTRK